MAPHRIGPINSVQEFMEAVWREPPRDNTAIRIFRGQIENWPLLPKLFRSDRRPQELRDLEYSLMRQFRERCFYLLPSEPEGQYDMMSLAQHHGLPTRLLDWSSNPLMGLFFAVDTLEPSRPTVWIHDASQEQVEDGKILNLQAGIKEGNSTTILNPSRHSQRVVAQAGLHTVHRLDGTGDGNLAVRAMNETEDANRLTLITIAPQKAKHIKHELKSMGIHGATVYGDLTSVCREIQDDLEIPFGMRRDGQYWVKRQHEMQVHVLATLLVNGLELVVGTPYLCLYEPNEHGNTVGGASPLSQELLNDAKKRARLYSFDYRVKNPV